LQSVTWWTSGDSPLGNLLESSAEPGVGGFPAQELGPGIIHQQDLAGNRLAPQGLSYLELLWRRKLCTELQVQGWGEGLTGQGREQRAMGPDGPRLKPPAPASVTDPTWKRSLGSGSWDEEDILIIQMTKP
jgi:hypothetical protein